MLLEGCSGNPMCRVRFPAALCLGSVGYGAGFRGSCVITPAPARPYASWQLYTVMFNENENEKSAQQGSCCGKLKFSELLKMVQSDAIEMDMPGVIVAVNQEYSLGRVETKGLSEKHKLNVIFPIMMGGLSQIAKEAVEYKPDALGTIAKWWGRNCQKDEVKGLLGGFLGSL